MALRETVKIIFDIIYELSNAPDGLSGSEIAAKYGIGRSTAHEYIGLIEDMGVPIYTEGQKYRVSEDYYVHLKLTTEESEFLFLALERSLTSYTTPSQIIHSLVSKLSRKLHPHLTGELQERFRQGQVNVESARIFTALVQAKNQRRVALVDYYPLNRAEASRWRIRPYRFMSNQISDGFYVLCDGIGDDEEFLSLSLKLDRIADVQLTEERFGNIDQARFQSHFGHAWGVWSSERDTTLVKLCFEPRHYDRLLESQWHPSESIRVDADGYVIYEVKVSEPVEMAPWIRSWGSGVVVEEPPELRQRIMRSLMRQVRHYGLSLGDVAERHQAHHLLWAKYDRKAGSYHLLIYHLLDVAAVACRLWDDVLSAGQQTWLQESLRLEEGPTRQLLALLVGAHDIGKATAAFQKKAKPLYRSLRDAGYHEHSDDTPHGTLSAVILKRWLTEKGISQMQASQLAAVIGGHHGDWITSAEANNAQAGKGKWRVLQDLLIAELAQALGVSEIKLPRDTERFNVFAAFISGFVSVCDWIGSNTDYFPFEEGTIDFSEYYARSLEQARTALADLGWFGWNADRREPLFESVFPFAPNSLQSAGIHHFGALREMPRLILVEYLTGGGKTELALHIGDLLVNRFGLSGSYIAMPTQATSNQMFRRIGEYLEERYPERRINLQLTHAQAEQDSRFQAIQPRPEREGDQSGVAAEDWFQRNSKYALLAPFGVGTIDQAMLSVLQAKHHFVRQFGLSHKVIIFDEIHSYDTFMNVIIERLFAWLHALNSPMILLSATLSRQGRRDILRATGARNLEDMDEKTYPRLTVVEHDGEVRTHELPRPETRTIHIEKIPPDLESLLGAILPLYIKGGCIAIVCNTVDESIAVARRLRQAEGIEPEDVQLFHARYPPAWRGEIESDVLKAFGKPSEETERPERAILVATQIIEQSLDLDFDLMVSSTAPIDLLIQRAGRLHRHPRPDRPEHLVEPTLLLRKPEMGGESVPVFGADEWVYERYFLLKSWLKLREMSALRSPDDIDQLMDFVYGEAGDMADVSEAYRHAIKAAAEDLGLNDARSAFRGGQDVIGEPSNERLIGRSGARLPDDEERHIATRDIRPGIDLICLTDADMRELIALVPSPADVATLLRHKVTVRNPPIKKALEALPEHGQWRRKPQLRFARPIVFDAGIYRVPGSPYRLQLMREYGLEIVEDE